MILKGVKFMHLLVHPIMTIMPGKLTRISQIHCVPLPGFPRLSAKVIFPLAVEVLKFATRVFCVPKLLPIVNLTILQHLIILKVVEV